jgi:hypothetical protein
MRLPGPPCPKNAGAGGGKLSETQPYFLPVGFLAVGEVLLPAAWVGLAEPVMGLLQLAAGLGVPFHESMGLLLNTASDNRRRVGRPNLHLEW